MFILTKVIASLIKYIILFIRNIHTCLLTCGCNRIFDRLFQSHCFRFYRFSAKMTADDRLKMVYESWKVYAVQCSFVI